jgi:hypothetical protein
VTAVIDHELLSIYLNDHLAGAAAGSQRMARLADAEKDAPDGGALAGVAREIEEDRLTLQRVVAEAAVEKNAVKEGLGWLAEKVGLLKLNGRWWRRSPLTSLLELEAMRMGVTGKLALWTSLENTSLAGSFDFGALVARARRQLEVLEEAHRQRAHASLDPVLV